LEGWKALVAAEFFTVEVWSWRGLMPHYPSLSSSSRLDASASPGSPFSPMRGMMQLGRNLLDVFDGPLVDKRYLIVDRDTPI
jgi:hypothetical protein